PFEIEQKIITNKNQNNLFDIGASLPVEIISKTVNSAKTIDEKINDSINDENIEKSSINEHDPELEEKILITCKGSGISLVSDDGRQLRNWPIPPQYSVITPAKCLIKSGRCYVYVIIHSESDGIGSDKVIWFWKDRKKSLDGSLQTKKKIREFERELFSLEISPLLPKNVILINKDGSLLVVKNNLKPAYNDRFIGVKVKKKRVVVWSTIFNSSGSCVPTNLLPHPSLVVLTISMNKSEKSITSLSSKHFFLTFTCINCNTLRYEFLAHYSHSDQSSTPLTFNFDPLTGRLFVLFSPGVLKVFMITFNVIDSKFDITLSEVYKFDFDGLLPFTEKCFSITQGECAIGFAPISDSYLALVGMQKTSVSINKVLTIWDLRYGTLQAEHVLGTLKQENPTDIISSPSLFKFQLIVAPGSNLIVSTLSESLPNNSNTFKLSSFLCRYYHEPMTLLHALNRMKDSSVYLQLGNGFTQGFGITRFGINSDKKLVSSKRSSNEFLNNIENHIKELQSDEYKFLKFLFSKSHTTEDIKKRFEKFVKKKGVKAFESFLKTNDINLDQYSKYTEYWKHNKKTFKKHKKWDVKTDESRKNIIDKEKVCEYLESGEKQRPELSYYFIQTVIEYCLSKNPDGTPNLNCWVPEIIQYFIKSKMISNNVVKNDLVYLLKHIISSETKTFSIGSILRYLITTPKNDNMMVWSLRQLTEDEVMIVIKILYGWIEKYDQTEFVREVLSTKQESQLRMHEFKKDANKLPEFHK
ncbi:1194_t:CDS:10, partial [Gigaspora margarita]